MRCDRPLLTLALLMLPAPPALAQGFLLTDAGRPMPAGTPLVLVVGTPGLLPDAYATLVGALEAEGLDAWLVRFPLESQDPDEIVAVGIPAAREALLARGAGLPVALVGHGLGGTLAARAALADPPTALAVLGAPLAPPSSALVRWLVDLPVPQDGLDLAQATAATWNGLPALPLLVGEPLPPLERVSAAWLHGLQAWARSGRAVDLGAAPFPVWAGTGLLDEVAPAEGVRPYLGETGFVRFGYLHLDLQAFDHAALLREERPAAALARWVQARLRR